MYSLFVDTAYKYLTIVIEKDNKVLASFSEECFKRQSEMLFTILDKLLKDNNIKREDIDSVYISDGPGSYTGVRISMTLAKVICEIKKIKLFRISTLKLYAANNSNTMVIMDARANRAYVGVYDEGKCILKDCVLPLNEINTKEYNVVLDGTLVNKDNREVDIVKAFMACKDDFEEVKDINHLVPRYLKESDSYYR